MDWEKWEKELAALPGRIGLYYRNLATGEEWGRLADERFESASVIKLPVFAAIERMSAAGEAGSLLSPLSEQAARHPAVSRAASSRDRVFFMVVAPY